MIMKTILDALVNLKKKIRKTKKTPTNENFQK